MKLKVIGLAAATCFFIVLMVLAYQSMWPDDRPESLAMLSAEGDVNEDAQVLKANEMLYNSSAELQKTNDNYTALLVNAAKADDLANAEKQLSQVEESFKNAIDKAEVTSLTMKSDGAKRSMSQIVASYKLLLKFQSFENANTTPAPEEVPVKTEHPETAQLKTDLQRKDTRIAQLEKQVRLLQNSKNNATPKVVAPADYQELVAKNKYLDFDLRSVIKSNIALTKEFEALKRTNQELNNQIRQLKN